MTAIERSVFGTTADKQMVDCYTLSNEAGMKVSIITYGGTITSCIVPDRNGNSVDVVLGYDNLKDYEQQGTYLGALIGRHANRIAKGHFTLNGKEYQLYCNDGPNHLHGGKVGFDKKIWGAEIKEDTLVLKYCSKDGEEGYPGNLMVTVVYSLKENNTLSIDYKANTDQDTVCNLTNHTYFNLSGHDSGTILEQKMQLFADCYTEADDECLPNGKILPVKGTPMDLQSPTVIGLHIDSSFPQLLFGDGYDHNWVIKDYDKTLRKAATASSDKTGIVMMASTTLPGIQFYAGNHLDGTADGKNGAHYYRRCGFCLESQYFPNALANPDFEQPILKAENVYQSTTTYQFSKE